MPSSIRNGATSAILDSPIGKAVASHAISPETLKAAAKGGMETAQAAIQLVADGITGIPPTPTFGDVTIPKPGRTDESDGITFNNAFVVRIASARQALDPSVISPKGAVSETVSEAYVDGVKATLLENFAGNLQDFGVAIEQGEAQLYAVVSAGVLVNEPGFNELAPARPVKIPTDAMSYMRS